MKRFIKLLSAFFISFMFSSVVNAAGVNFTVSSSANQVIVGKTVTVSVTISSGSPIGSYEYTLNYDKNVFKCTDAGVGLNYAGVVNNNSTYNVTYKYTFVAQKSGTGKFYIDSSNAFDFNEAMLSPVNGSKSVKSITYAEYEASLSKNNYLKDLSVDGYEIDPKFDKDTLEYTVQVKEDETKVKIVATPEDNRSNVTGDGEVEVSSGSNTFDIVVIAENGSEKTYKLTVDVVDKDPINVEVDGVKYTVVKIKNNLTTPIGFKEDTIKIKDFDIPAFSNDVVDITLVGLKDEEGNISLFIYKNDKYIKYIELNFGNVVIYPLSMSSSVDGYYKSTVKIKDNNIECLINSKSTRFVLIYGQNIETNEKGLYVYDKKDNTAIRYDEDTVKVYTDKVKLYFYIAAGFAGATLLSLILLIIVSSKKGKKSKIKKSSEITSDNDSFENVVNDEIQEQNIEEPKEVIINNEEEVFDIFEKNSKKRKR